MDYISISKACKIGNMSVKKVLTFLAKKEIIPKQSQRKNKLFEANNGLKVISNGKSLVVEKQEFFDYLNENASGCDLVYTDENTDILDIIENPKVRFRRLEEAIKDKTLVFIDAEFKEGNYHEIAWEKVRNGVLIEKRYILERKHFMKKLKSPVEFKRYNRLKKYNQHFEIKTRKQINKELKKSLEDMDFIIAHNAYGERNVLITNGMYYEKSRYLCTSKLAKNFVGHLSPSLKDLVFNYKLPHNSHFFHYAHEDAKLAKDVFYAMINDAKERFNI